MSCLLSRLPSYFDKSFGGRYFEYIIKELSYEDPVIINSIFNKNIFKTFIHEIHVEYQFPINGRNRFADIAIVDKETSKPIGLIEIKYEDHRLDKNAMQLKDYLKRSKEDNIPFVYLTQHVPPFEHSKVVTQQGQRHILFSDLGEALQNRGKKNNASFTAKNLLINFFKDRGYMFANIDDNGLWKFLVRLLNPRTGQGKIRNSKDIIENIPQSFVNIMANFSIINTEIYRRLPDNIANPTIDFILSPTVKLKASRMKQLVSDKEETVDIYHSEKAGGLLCIYSEGPILRGKPKEPWVYWDYGFEFTIKPRDKFLNCSIYAEVTSKALAEGDESYGAIWEPKNISSRKLSDKTYLVGEFSDLINKVFLKAIKNKKIGYASKRLKNIYDSFHL